MSQLWKMKPKAYCFHFILLKICLCVVCVCLHVLVEVRGCLEAIILLPYILRQCLPLNIELAVWARRLAVSIFLSPYPAMGLQIRAGAVPGFMSLLEQTQVLMFT